MDKSSNIVGCTIYQAHEARKLSFDDILTLNILKTLIFTACEKLMQVLEYGEYKNGFPLDAVLLEAEERVKARKVSMERMFNFL